MGPAGTSDFPPLLNSPVSPSSKNSTQAFSSVGQHVNLHQFFNVLYILCFGF